MAARASMSDLIRRLRVLIGDPSSVTWTNDEDLQDQLDSEHQYVHRYLTLRMEPTRTPGGYVYNNFYSDSDNNWELDVVLNDASYNDITATATLADLLAGHWEFPAQPMIPVYATGKCYDLFGAGADLLEAEGASSRHKFDVSEAGGASAKRSQQITTMLSLAEKYRAKARTHSTQSFRSDGGTVSVDVTQWAGRGGFRNVGRPNV